MSSRRNVAVCFLLFILYFAAGSVAHSLFMDAVSALGEVDTRNGTHPVRPPNVPQISKKSDFGGMACAVGHCVVKCL